MGEAGGLLRETKDDVVLVTINCPERRNAISRVTWLELRDLLTELRDDPATRGLIITGAGNESFASGADVTEMVDRDPLVALDGLVQGILRQLEDLPFPTIAAINGHALGGGWELALACDLRVTSAQARVGFPEVGLGIMPGAGGTQKLVQHVGLTRAKEWILTGRILDAGEAFAHSLVNRVVEEDVVGAARALMEKLLSQPPTAVRIAKVMLNAAARGDGGPDLERVAYTLTFHSPERAERMRAFLDRGSDRSRQ